MSRPVSRTRQVVHLILLSIVLCYRILWWGSPIHWTICLILVAATALSYWISSSGISDAPPLSRWSSIALVAFPFYVVLQLIPMPLAFLKVISPATAEMYGALGSVMPPVRFAPLSLVPSDTSEHLMRLAAYISIFLLIREIGSYLPHRRWLLAFPIIAIGSVEAVLGVLQHALNIKDGIARGTYPNQDHFASLLEMSLPFSVMYGIANLRRTDKRSSLSVTHTLKAGLTFCLGALMLVGIIFSLSRAALFAALASLWIIALIGLMARLKQRKIWILCAAVLGTSALFLLSLFLLSSQLLILRYAQTFISETRFPIWRDAIHTVKAFPLFGCGLGNFEAGFIKFQTADVTHAYVFAHNDYLQLLTELGFIGVLIPATLAVLMIKSTLSSMTMTQNAEHFRRRILSLACIGSLTAILIHSFVDFNLYMPANALVLFWVFGICAGFPRSPELHIAGPKQDVSNSTVWLRGFAVTLSGILIVYSSAWLLLDARSQSNLPLGDLLCRFGICQGEVLLPDARQFQTTAISGNELAISGLRKELSQDPSAPNLWCDLGDSLQRSGQVQAARACFDRVHLLAPNIPSILLRVANFHFSVKEDEKAFEQTSRLLRLTSFYDAQVFELYEGTGASMKEILRYGIPENRRAAQAYVRYLIGLGKLASAREAWGWVNQHSYADDKLAGEQVLFLVKNREYQAAAEAWASYLGKRGDGYLKSNWMFNGSFELEPTGTFFDWNVGNKDANVTLDKAVAQSGGRSLCIHFNGTSNLDYTGVSQVAYVQPGKYRFDAFVRTEKITTDHGIGFRILDHEKPSRLDIKTEQLLGTTDWKNVEQNFVVPQETKLLDIQIIRERSWKFDGKINGTAWIDSVKLEREH